MFEGVILGFAVFVGSYVGFMRLMARRADVLHGEFIWSEQAPLIKQGSPLIATIQRGQLGRWLTARH